jgi:hypothetical protein
VGAAAGGAGAGPGAVLGARVRRRRVGERGV